MSQSLRSRTLWLWVERDRLLTAAALPVFGVWSLVDPTPSLALLPEPLQACTYILFILSGPLLLIGTFAGRLPFFVVGHIVGIIAMLTVAAIVAVTSQSPVTVLIAGFATAQSFSLQKTLRERRIIQELAADTRPLPVTADGEESP